MEGRGSTKKGEVKHFASTILRYQVMGRNPTGTRHVSDVLFIKLHSRLAVDVDDKDVNEVIRDIDLANTLELSVPGSSSNHIYT